VTEPPESRALTPLARDVAELRAKYRGLLARRATVDQFEALWDQFVERLRLLVAQMNGQPWNPADEHIAGEVAAVDDMRLDLYSRQSTALNSYRDPLSTILRTSLRQPAAELYEFLGPLDSRRGVQRQIVSLARFDAVFAEGKADIVRVRRELEAEIQREEARLHELQDAVSSLILATVRSLLWKNWRRRLATTTVTLIVGALMAPVRAAALAVWGWIRWLF
jgi:hypothetical protein